MSAMSDTSAVWSWLRRRPPEAVAFAVLCTGAAACLGVAVAFPMSPQAPVALGLAMIPIALGLAAAALVFGHRAPRGALLAGAVLAAVLNSALVAAAHTTGGALGDALAYAWLMVYVGLFFPWAAHGFALLIAVGFGLGLLASGLPGMVTGWAVLSITTWTLGAVLCRVSRIVRRHIDTDALTGVLNRQGLQAATARLRRHRRRRDEPLAVAMIDLDGFKQINDRDGHAAGDRLLTEAATAWRAALRSDDVLARVGGDEFVIVMPGTTEDEAATVLERLRRTSPVALSAGVTLWEVDESLEECLRRADGELYAAKAVS